MMANDQNPQTRHDEITRLIQEGRRPEDLKGRARLAADKMMGNVPLGVDAPNKTARKVIGGAGSLFTVIKYGFFGLLAVILGALFIWAGCNGQFDMKVTGIGLAVLLLGVFGVWRALRAWRVLKAISRA
jgi:hypothetical protein